MILTAKVHTYCGDGFDAFERAVREDLGETLTPEHFTSVLRGSAALYAGLRSQLDAQLEKFEQYALAEILKVPAGLLANTVGAGVGELLGFLNQNHRACADATVAGQP
jgi:hypothetical protein